MKNSFCIALCSVITALSVIFMLMTSILPIASYTCVMLAGMCTALITEEIDSKYALCVYSAVSVLSALLVPDKESVVLYIGFFGYFPVLKEFLSRKCPNIVSVVIKAAVFNAACVVSFYTSVYLFGVPKESFSIGDLYVPWAVLIMANIMFVIYDYTLDVMLKLYRIKLRKYILKIKR